MQTSVTFKNLDPSEHLKAYVSDKLDRFDKFLDNPAKPMSSLLSKNFDTSLKSTSPATNLI